MGEPVFQVLSLTVKGDGFEVAMSDMKHCAGRCFIDSPRLNAY